MYFIFMYKYLLLQKRLANIVLLHTQCQKNTYYVHFNPNWTGRGQSRPCQLWPQIAGKLIKYFTFIFLPIPAKMSSRSFWNSYIISKNDVLTSILTYFRQKLGRGVACLTPPPPSTWFYCYYRSPEAGRCPTGQWSAVRCGASQKVQCFRLRAV